MTTALHIGIYLFAAVGVGSALQEAPRIGNVRRARRHDALMERIFRLELESGLGVDVSREWFERQPTLTKHSQYHFIGQWQCYGCGQWKEANGRGFHKLCRACRDRACDPQRYPVSIGGQPIS